MKRFTEAYQKAAETVSKQKFEPEWQKFLEKDGKMRDLFTSKGPQSSAAKGPVNIAKLIDDSATKDKLTTGAVIMAAAKNDKSGGSLNDRAATLKMARHMHRASAKGSQSVWVYSPPKAHASWIFDELTGSSVTDTARLSNDEELFTETEIKWMVSALTLSLKICEDTRAKVSALLGASKNTKDIVKRWFLDDSCGEDELKEALATLRAGFKKIAVACNSSRLVFTDYPDWRAQRDDYFGGAIRGGEGGGFPVLYLEGAFTRLTGNSGKLWLCAETIIHELSHYEVSTRDHRYDSSGLKPDSAILPYAKAIENADSWGYFALDLAGYLSDADRSAVLK